VAAATTAAVTDGHTRYTAVAGTRELREEIARYLSEKKGLPYTGNQVLVSSGGKQSLVQVTMGMCGPGDEVLVPAPHWVRRCAARQEPQTDSHSARPPAGQLHGAVHAGGGDLSGAPNATSRRLPAAARRSRGGDHAQDPHDHPV